MSKWIVNKLERAGYPYRGRLGTFLSDFYPSVLAEIDVSLDILDYPIGLSKLPEAQRVAAEEYGEFLASCASRLPSEPLHYLDSPEWAQLYQHLGPAWFSTLINEGVLLKPEGHAWIQIVGKIFLKSPLAPRSRTQTPSFDQNKDGSPRITSFCAKTLIKKQDALALDIRERFIDLPRDIFFPNLKPRYSNQLSPLLTATVKRLKHLSLDLDRICGSQDKLATREAVSNAAFAGIKRVLPVKLIGTVNHAALRRGVREWVFMGWFDTASTEFMARTWKTSGLEWLGKSTSVEHQRLAQKMLLHLVFWIYSWVLPRIVRRYFHVVRHSKSPGGCFYYRRDLWRKKRLDALVQVKQSLSSPVPADMPMALEPARVHFVMKSDTELRAVMNLSGLKKWLRHAQLVLPLLSRDMTSILRSPVDFIPRLTKFTREHFGRRFYVVKADIANCYDTANTTWLLKELQQKLTCANFEIQYFWDQRRGCQSSVVVDTKLPLKRLPSRMDGGILRPNGVERVSGNDVFRTLWLLLQHLPVHILGETLCKNYGIPQGSSVSNSLCNLFLGTVFANELADFLADENSLFVQFVDDILFVSPSEQQAARFLRRINQGFPKYNVAVRPEKTQTNLGGSELSRMVFLGTCFKCDSLQILPLKPIRFHLLVDHPQEYIRKRLEAMLSLRYIAVFHAFSNRDVPMSDNVIRQLARGLGISLAARMHYLGVTRAGKRPLFEALLKKVVGHYLRRGGRSHRLFISVCIREYRRRCRRYT